MDKKIEEMIELEQSARELAHMFQAMADDILKDMQEEIRKEKEERYCVPLPWLKTTDGAQQYLTHKEGAFFACRKKPGLRQAWKKEDLFYLPDEYKDYAVKVIGEDGSEYEVVKC